jgi:hypothetical protein
MTTERDYSLPDLARALERAYPYVRVLEAKMVTKHAGGWHQSVRLAAPLVVLRAYGLVTKEMVAYAKAFDGRRSRPRPPRGDDFFLREALDQRTPAGSWDLTLYTEASADRDDLRARSSDRRAAERATRQVLEELRQP